MFMAVNQTATSKLWLFLSNMIKPRRKSFTLGTVETITLFFVVKKNQDPLRVLYLLDLSTLSSTLTL